LTIKSTSHTTRRYFRAYILVLFVCPSKYSVFKDRLS